MATTIFRPTKDRMEKRLELDDHFTCVFHAGFGVGYFMSESRCYRNFTQTHKDFVSLEAAKLGHSTILHTK